MTSPLPLVVADSNIVSYIARRSPIADYYLPYLERHKVVISFQTWEEALFGAYLRNWGARRLNDLEIQLGQYEVVWANTDLIRISAHLRRQRQLMGRRLEKGDAWIAATALYLDCPLASHDGDFEDIPDLLLIRAPNP